jgi:uncharacterized protein YhbP (UPF0306 family)
MGIDEPALSSVSERADGSDAERVEQQIRGLVEGQQYGVLCTQGGDQPYGSLVAYAFDASLSGAVFATPVTTRKYRLLSECDRVSLLIDNRARFGDDVTRVEAVTATGRAVRLTPGPDLEPWSSRLLERHAYLESFLSAPSTALIRIDVVRFFHVERFQEVRQWIPTPPG